jgi:hypothetical protein
MRRRLLVSAALAAAAVVAVLLPTSSASADGTTVVTIGPGQYTLGFTHPTGTISVGGGTISARCTAQADKGSAALQTPGCATRAIACPATATSCSVVWNGRESALRGPVAVNGLIVISGGWATSSYISPYNCPQQYSCGARLLFTGIPPGSVIQAGLENVAFSPNFPNVFNQVTLTVH